MNYYTVRRLAEVAEAINVIEFFVTCDDQRTPKFGCRFWEALKQLGKDRAESLAADLNIAIDPVITKWVQEIESQIHEALKR